MLRTVKQMRWLLVMAAALLIGIVVSVAQDNDGPVVLLPGESVRSTLDDANLGRIFTFQTQAGQVVSLDGLSISGVALTMLVSDAAGQRVAQATDQEQLGIVSIPDLTITSSGVYYVTVFSAQGGEGDFEIVLRPSEAAPLPTPAPEATPEVAAVDAEATPEAAADVPEQVLVQNGAQVTLSWDAPVDLNLEVRDPNGDTLFWNSRSTVIGGEFGLDANGLCETIVAEPQETALWAPGFLPTGSYEILVYYRQACEVADPVAFSLDLTVNGQTLSPLQGTLLPPAANQESVFLSSFVIDGEGGGSVGAAGVYPSSSLNVPVLTGDELQAQTSQPIALDTPVQSAISNDTYYHLYSFQGQANDIVSISLSRTSGSLDTLLQVVDANGNLLDVNDDFNGTDSVINNLRLVQDGIYTIIATRYGKDIGGTQGDFELTLSGPSDTLPPEVANLNLPAGDVQISLSWQTNADLQLLVRDPVGAEIYDDQPLVNSGGQLVANGNVNCTPAEGGVPVSYIYWPTGLLRAGVYEIQVWFQSNCGDTRVAEFTLTIVVNGEVVTVERAVPLVGQRYAVSVQVNPDGSTIVGPGGIVGGSETLEWQADAASAVAIRPGQPVSGSINQSNVFDLYTFTGAIGDTISVRMEATSPPLDTKLLLMGPNGAELAENDDADPLLYGTNERTTNSLINNYTLPQTGEYTIIATRFATAYGGTTGSYSLTLSGD